MKSKIHKYLLKNKVMSKTLQIKTFKSLVNISLVLVLFTSACAQSGNNSKAQADNSIEVKSVYRETKNRYSNGNNIG